MGKADIAVAALVLSIVALLWNVGLTWLRWPRLSLEIQSWPRLGAALDTPAFKVVAINHGAESITIRNLGLGVREEDAGDWIRTLDYEIESERNEAARPRGPELPHKIDGRGVAEWTYTHKQVETFSEGTELAAYAYRYKVARVWRGRPLAKYVESQKALPKRGSLGGPATWTRS